MSCTVFPPEQDRARLSLWRQLQILDPGPDACFDALTRLAADVCAQPVALLGLLDQDRIWFKSVHGVSGLSQMPRALSLCAATLQAGRTTMIEDVRTVRPPMPPDLPLPARLADLRLYAGTPLRLSDGRVIGSLCVSGPVPGRLDAVTLRRLEQIAALAAQAIEMRAKVACTVGSLRDSRQMLEVTLSSIADAVITTDAQGRVRWMNPVAERMTGWCGEAARGLPIEVVYQPVDEVRGLGSRNPVRLCLAEHRPVLGCEPMRLTSRQGHECCIEDSAAPIQDEAGHLQGVVLVFHDVTEQRRLHREMLWRASHDPLTGLFNRSEFDVRLQRVVERVHREGSSQAVLYLDLDQFKLINDACGHPVGDRLLVQIGQLLDSCVRPGDLIARLGGDEFGVLLERCGLDQARRIAQLMGERLEAFRFLHDGRRFRIGASIGLVPVDARWRSAEAVMRAADSACYLAKEAGRNRVHLWFDADETLRQRQGQMDWAHRIERALDDDLFELHAQRIVPVAASRASAELHCEVLLRLREQPGGAAVPPGVFLPAAERFQLASRIDRWVVQQVFLALDAAAERGLVAGCISVNLSGQSLGDHDFHLHVVQLVQAARFDVRVLCFEVTETAAITDLPAAAGFMAAMRELGIRIALDDFGAGASSFGYLKSLPVDMLKIDGQFIRDLGRDALDLATVRCFRDIAQVVGVTTVAEFVEAPEVLALLAELGIDHAQGYLLHRPEPFGAVLQQALEALEAPGAGRA
ncbi:MAG: hypothetical protein RLZZ592_327 [Pseudomonadota bacterium]|jgi:diguanylate cyclase (GGDEF)-like protein/PAS domain S-box-containing protein